MQDPTHLPTTMRAAFENATVSSSPLARAVYRALNRNVGMIRKRKWWHVNRARR